ncbi:DUF6603 domain-containing protein [Streptomyces olivoreticuli]
MAAEPLVHDLDRLLGENGALIRLVDAVATDASRLPELEQLLSDKRHDLIAELGAALPPIPGLRDELLAAAAAAVPPVGWSRTAGLGPAQVGLQAPAAIAQVSGQPEPFVLGLVPELTGRLGLGAPGLAADGTLSVAPGRLAGSLGVGLGPIKVLGFAVLNVPDQQPASLLVLLSAHPIPAIQLGFGFSLRAVGGVVGVNRRVDTEALRAGLADGSALRTLFPEDAVCDAPTLLEALGRFFPSEHDTHVIGPTLSITWLDVGDAGSLVRADLGLLVQLPDVKAVIVGRAAVDLPPVLALRLDVLGEVDPARQLVALDAVLVDSRALGIFQVTGTGALRVCWGTPPYVVVEAGGLYPGFDPAPAVLPPQQRLGLVLDTPIASFLSLRAEAYLAITSNSFQAGGRFETGIDLVVISAHGFIALDAIITFDPFHLHVDYQSGFRVRIGIFSGGTTVSGWLDGPGPWTLHAAVSIDLLLDDLTWSDTFRIGPSGPPAQPPLDSLVDPVVRELKRPSNLHAAGADDRTVSVAPVAGPLPDGTAVVSPLGHLRWAQTLVPLGLQVARAGGRRLARAQSVDVTTGSGGVTAKGPYADWFAPGTFLDLTTAEACQLPPFQQLKAGCDLAGFPMERGSAAAADLEFDEFWRRPGQPLSGRLPGLFLEHPDGLNRLVAAQEALPVVTGRSSLMSMGQETWTVLATDGTGQREQVDSAAHALVAARGGGLALPEADGPVPAGGL